MANSVYYNQPAPVNSLEAVRDIVNKSKRDYEKLETSSDKDAFKDLNKSSRRLSSSDTNKRTLVDHQDLHYAETRVPLQVPVNLVTDSVSLHVKLVTQLDPDWINKYSDFSLRLDLKHGQSCLCCSIETKPARVISSSLSFDELISFSITYSDLPRETRIVISLIGTEILAPQPVSTPQLATPGESKPLRRSNSTESTASTTLIYFSTPKSVTKSNDAINEPIRTRLAIATSYLFDHELNLKQGRHQIFFHALSDERREVYHEFISNGLDSLIILDYKCFPKKKIFFPNAGIFDSVPDLLQGEKSIKLGFNYENLDPGVRFVLEAIIREKHSHEELLDDEKTLLWDNRLFLTSKSVALPLVLLSVPSWSAQRLNHIYHLVESWTPLCAVDALQLLLPIYPDSYIRGIATSWLSNQTDDELLDYLPQLIQVFRFERSIDCPIFWLLLKRACFNVRIANLLYWQLKLSSCDRTIQERTETLVTCVLWSCGSSFWKGIDKQEVLLAMLTKLSGEVKKVRDSQRMKVLHKNLQTIDDFLIERKPTLPWNPTIEICDLKINSCSYFPSNTLPLKLAFRSCEFTADRSVIFHTHDTIFKVGDDLRQDMLAMQMIKIMQKLWLKEGLDLKMITFECLATSENQGMVEMVQNAETLRKIHQNANMLTGAFDPRAIDNYIRLWNTSELEYKVATDRFLHSCAGYSVATYILGICDRHNDNIMITNLGHLFHIDFGKFLGDVQMMGAIRRDRTPFVLTADMAYVINGGDRPSKKFQTFIELCTLGFNIIRRHRILFLNLFSLMSSANIHGLNGESVKYIDKMLMPNLTEAEAMAKFNRLINECLNSRSAQVNFFIHNLAQLRFSNDSSKQKLLSFVPKTFTIQSDGKIESLSIVHFYKEYERDKQYYYVIRVKRVDHPEATSVTRTFREFSELQMKLNYAFPCYQFQDIGRTSTFLFDFVGRFANTRDLAQRRLIELRMFLTKLLRMPPEISECSLIYTFFHPILRDQTTLNNSFESSITNETSSTIYYREHTEAQRKALYFGSNGQVKLSLSYSNYTFTVMIMHAKNLNCPEGTSGPNCYAKTYLLPDPHKQTKRKTKVVKQSCHPSFMELIKYELPIEKLNLLTLQVSIWHAEIVQYKALLGAALIPLNQVDLTRESTCWYPLKNF